MLVINTFGAIYTVLNKTKPDNFRIILVRAYRTSCISNEACVMPLLE